MANITDFELPPRPEKPDDSDCCKSDCETCIFTVYEEKLSEWEKLCNAIRSGGCSETKDLPSVLSPIKYIPFQLVAIKSVTCDTNIYCFQVSEKDLEQTKKDYSLNLNIGIGQHLILKNNDDINRIITRAYTPISNTEDHIKGCFEVLIKIYSDGRMSQFIRTWNTGDIIYWRGPFGDFKYLRNQYEQIIICCAGTGIAPMLRLIKTLVEDEEEETIVNLLYSCKLYDQVLMIDTINYFQSFWNFSCYFFVTREIPQKVRYGDHILSGRINADILKKISKKSLKKSFVLICGTSSFNEDIQCLVKEGGVVENNIYIF